MKKQYTHSGYILIFALMVVTIAALLVATLLNKTLVFDPYARTSIAREKAYLLALGGVQIGISQLAEPQLEKTEDKGNEKKDSKPSKEELDRALLTTLLPVLNRWQTFALTKAKDGVNGTIKICIMSENGKLDINALWDFKNKKFNPIGNNKDGIKKMLQTLFGTVEKTIGATGLLKGFEKFLKERQYKVQDVTQLLTATEFKPFTRRVFYTPAETEKNKPLTDKKSTIFLTDLFTVWSGDTTVDPWLLSPSVITMLGLQTVDVKMIQKPEALKSLLKNFKPEANWETDWNNTVKMLYQKPYNQLPKDISPLLSPTFSPTVFTIIAHATVDNVTQKVRAIVTRSAKPNKHHAFTLDIKQLYWL